MHDIDQGLRGFHSCTGSWKIDGRSFEIDLQGLIPYLKSKEPQIILHDQIAWHKLKMYGDSVYRFRDCDITCPGIVAANVPNPRGKPYRLIDGKHRLHKIKQETNAYKSAFYVLSKEEFYAIISDDQWVREV